MFNRIYTIILLMLTLTAYNHTPAISAGADLTVNAAEYICVKAREGKKTRLAVYSFTDDKGGTSAETKGYSTKIIAHLLNKNEFKVIDPERVPELIDEQEKGLTGLVDPETAAETGKLIGADAMIFGIAGSGSLQVRIIDASTGEIIGATLEENGGKTDIKDEDFKSPDGKKRFMIVEFERNLRRIYENKPMLYLYITANDNELTEINELFPDAVKRLEQQINQKDRVKSGQFEKRKRKLVDFRNLNPGFNSRIQESRKSLIERMKDNKKKKKKKL